MLRLRHETGALHLASTDFTFASCLQAAVLRRWPSGRIRRHPKTGRPTGERHNNPPSFFHHLRSINIQKTDVIARNKDSPQNRFFVKLLSAGVFTSTAFTTLAVTSTVTTATVIKCIPSSQFSSSTTACGRRRRAVDQMLLANAGDFIRPDQPIP